MGGDNVPPLVEIGLTDLPKSGGAMAPPAPPGTTGLNRRYHGQTIDPTGKMISMNLFKILCVVTWA